MAKRFLHNNKHGLSTIVITLILITLSLVAIGLVWTFANNLIQKQISNSQSCFGVSDKFKINGQYTCYNQIGTTSPYTYSLRFSLSIGDINVDKLIVGVSSASSTQSYTLTNTAGAVSGLVGSSKLPDKNAGLTYTTTNSFANQPDSIKIAPVIGGTQCEVADSISDIQNCIGMGP